MNDDDLIVETLDPPFPKQPEDVVKKKLDHAINKLFDSLNLPKEMEDILDDFTENQKTK